MIQFTGYLVLALLFYTDVAFPVSIVCRGRLFPRPWKTRDDRRQVSIIIICFNEARGIQRKIENIFETDYPSELLEVIVASDGSDDGTNQIIEKLGHPRVKLLAMPRRGKIPALNDAVASATGEILVFTDANSHLTPKSIGNLIRHFADSEIGCVAGNQVYVKTEHEGRVAHGEKSYWNFDRKLKEHQAFAGNATSATGAFYAIRRSLFKDVPPGVTDDFTISTHSIREGYRLVFDNEAIASEASDGKIEKELQRKIRIMTRGLRAVLISRDLLNPVKHGFYSIQLFSHKVMRRTAIIPLIILLVISPWLFATTLFFQAVAVSVWTAVGILVLSSLTIHTSFGRWKPVKLVFFFGMVNFAALIAIFNICVGKKIEKWNSTGNEIHPDDHSFQLARPK